MPDLIIDNEILLIYYEEATELLESIEHNFEKFKQDGQNLKLIESIKRGLHTFKGSTKIVGYVSISELIHHLENFYLQIEKQSIIPSKEILNIAEWVHKFLCAMIDAIKTGKELPDNSCYIKTLEEIISTKHQAIQSTKENQETQKAQEKQENQKAQEKQENQKTQEKQENQKAQEKQKNQKTQEIQEIEETQDIHDNQKKQEGQEIKEYQEKQIGVDDSLKIKSSTIDNIDMLLGENSLINLHLQQHMSLIYAHMQTMKEKLISIEDSFLSLEHDIYMEKISNKNSGNSLLHCNSADNLQFNVNLGERLGLQVNSAESSSTNNLLNIEKYSNIEVTSNKLSSLLHQTSLLHKEIYNNLKKSQDLIISEAKIHHSMQVNLKHVRMVPVQSFMQKFKLLIKQVSSELNKSVKFKISYQDLYDIDKKVMDKIAPAIEHIIRNAIDHGIENNDQRIASKKVLPAVIEVNFKAINAEIHISISDDGKGLDLQDIKQKAMDLQLISSEDAIDCQRAIQLILRPGFSTKTSITQISGRGIGLDVVNNNVNQLGGRLEIDTNLHQGSTFRIILPAKSLIQDGLLVKVSNQVFAIKRSHVNHIDRLPKSYVPILLNAYRDIKLIYQEQSYNLLPLIDCLNLRQNSSVNVEKSMPILFLTNNGVIFPIMVDEVVGIQELIMKNFENNITQLPLFSGATIMANGEIVLILNIKELESKYFALFSPVNSGMQNINFNLQQVIKVMVVDDSLTVRKVTQNFLLTHGYEIILAEDGMDALEELKIDVPNIIITDIEMPKINGFELAVKIREHPQMRYIPIIMITSRVSDIHKEHAVQVGVNAFLGKPYEPEQLLSLIKKLT